MLLNGLYGYFGRKSYDSVIEIIKEKNLDEKILSYEIYNIIGCDNGENYIVKRGRKPIEGWNL